MCGSTDAGGRHALSHCAARRFRSRRPTTWLRVFCSFEMASDPVRCLLRATNFAAIKHKDQRRKDPSQTPYINHPIGECGSRNISHAAL